MAGHILIPNPTTPSFNPSTVVVLAGRGLNQYLQNKDSTNTIPNPTSSIANTISNTATDSTNIDIHNCSLPLIDASTVCNMVTNPAASAFEDPSSASWPPRSYHCSFCNREFRSAQALGGHMNVHRRDRARLRHSSPNNLHNNSNNNSSSTNEELNLCSSNSNSCSTSATHNTTTTITNNNINHNGAAVINIDDSAASSNKFITAPTKSIFCLLPTDKIEDSTKFMFSDFPLISPNSNANYNTNVPITEKAVNLSLTNQLIPSLSSLSSLSTTTATSLCNSYANKNINHPNQNHKHNHNHNHKTQSSTPSSPSLKLQVLQSNNQAAAIHTSSNRINNSSYTVINNASTCSKFHNKSLLQLKSEKPKKKFAVPFQPYINLQLSASSSMSSSSTSPTRHSLIGRPAVDVIRHSRAQINCDTSPTVIDLELRL